MVTDDERPDPRDDWKTFYEERMTPLEPLKPRLEEES